MHVQLANKTDSILQVFSTKIVRYSQSKLASRSGHWEEKAARRMLFVLMTTVLIIMKNLYNEPLRVSLFFFVVLQQYECNNLHVSGVLNFS